MKIAFWNDETGKQDERDMTPEEIAEFQAAQSAPVAVEVTRRQGLQALFLAGVTKADITDFIGAIEDATARGLALIEFEDATVFRSDNALVIAAAAHFNLDLQELFARAAAL